MALLLVVGLLARANGAGNQSEQSKEQKVKPVFAFIALSEYRSPTEQRIRDALREYLPKKSRIDNVKIDEPERMFSFDLQGESVVVAHIAVPIPWEDLEAICESSLFWSEATKVMKRHQSHVIVTLLGQGDARTHLERNILLTKVLAAITEILPAVGVYWGNGQVVAEPEFFRDAARDASAKEPPLLLWVGLHLQKNTDNTISVVTTGLDYFDCMDIEVLHSKRPVEDILGMIAGTSHLMLMGDKFGDGDTVGSDGDPNEKINTRHAKSVIDRDEQVLVIEM